MTHVSEGVEPHGKKMTILKFGGKEAVTHYKTEEIIFYGLISLLECRLTTGRTHQIRVQLSYFKHTADWG